MKLGELMKPVALKLADLIKEAKQEERERLKENGLYVVTFGSLGENKGEFFQEEAFQNKADAMWAAIVCMNQHGGRDRFDENITRSVNAKHVVRAWDSSDTTVWLEKLVLRAALDAAPEVNAEAESS